jgi:glutamyl/glutaminyl-tRNA synthetase
MSGHLDQVEAYAKQLVERELAYVDDLSHEELNHQRHSQQESLSRQNGRAENLALWQEMANGQDGRYLRLKIDMKHENGIMRDPVIMTVRNQTHYRTGHRAIYPMYDFISPILDALLGVTHVFRSNEFTERSELHQWILDQLNLPKPEFHTFLRLNLENTILSKRKLRQLVSDGVLTGWDDPQCPTVSGIRRRGILPQAFFDYFSGQEQISNLSLATWNQIHHYNRLLIDPVSDRYAALGPDQVVLPVYRAITDVEVPHQKDVLRNPKSPSSRTRALHLPDRVMVDRRDYDLLKEGDKVILMNYGFFIFKEGAFREISNPKRKEHRYILSWLDPDRTTTATVTRYLPLFTEREVCFADDPVEHLSPRLAETREISVEAALLESAHGAHLQLLRMGYFYIQSHQPLNLIYVPDTVEQYLNPFK